MLKAELEALCKQQAARIEELEAEIADLPRHEITTVADSKPQYLIFGYLVFGSEHMGAGGGWDDYQQCFTEEDIARTRAEELVAKGWAWAQVVELPTGRAERCHRHLSGEACWRED